MRRSKWGKACLGALTVGVVAIGAVRGDDTPVNPAQVVVIREAGKPEQRCLIEHTLSQPDGKVVYVVRDLATGERMRVVDSRSRKSGGPMVGTIVGRVNTPSDAGMANALSSAPGNDAAPTRMPTTAELANSTSKSAASAVNRFKRSTPGKSTETSPVQTQLTVLKDGDTPSQREIAAMTLAVSEARTKPEVVKAIMHAAKEDPAATVRSCCIRCLYHVSGHVPDVVPVIKSLQNDASAEVAQTAKKALEDIARNHADKPKP